MNLELPEVAAEFGATARRAFADAGGVELARRAEADPAVRATVVAPLLAGLGAFDLPLPLGPDDGDIDADVALAAGELCRAAGRVALPYPLAAVLASPDGTERPIAVVDPELPRADHGDLFPTWQLATLDGGRAWTGAPSGQVLGTKLGPFVTDLRLDAETLDRDLTFPAALALALDAWRVLGTLERALETTAAHVTSREQFGQPLAGFQAVQFQVADATVAARALRELAGFTTWRLCVAPLDRLVDALALRVNAVEGAQQVLRTCHQLHGAIGFCDEHDLSVLSRHVQPQLRLPGGLEATTEHLLAAVEELGFSSLFGEGSSPAPAASGST